MPKKGDEIPMAERVEKFIFPVTESGCWLWNGGHETRGWPFLNYGRIWVRGRTLPAHRVAYEHFVGPIPEGMLVLHKCDVPLCVNPDHLFLGTYRDNTMDMIRKGRFEHVMDECHRGEKSSFAKITAQQVISIRADRRLQKVIAEEHGITQTMVSRIKLRKAWKHLQ